MFECNYVYITEGVEKEKVATTVKGSGGFLNQRPFKHFKSSYGDSGN